MTWVFTKLKFIARFGYGDALPANELQEGPFRVFGSNGPYAFFPRPNTQGPAIIVGRKGSYGKVNWTTEPCFASDTTFFIDSSTTQHELRWIFWLLQTLRLDEGSDEAAVPGLNRESAYDKQVGCPPRRVQRAIADYLDHETARLDALVAAKERVLGLLAEKRRALITRAVTRGLDPSAGFRDSGVAWLGETPGHWSLLRGKFLWQEQSLSVRENDEMVTCFRDGQVTLRRNRREEGFTNANKELGYQGIRAGQLVVHSMDAFAGAIGVSDSDGKSTPEYIVCDPLKGDVSNPYFGFLLRVMALNGFIQASCCAVRERAPRIHFSDLGNMFFPLPPLREQQTIEAHITVEAAKLDAVRSATERTVALLKERRAALIAAAVTGQMDVESAA